MEKSQHLKLFTHTTSQSTPLDCSEEHGHRCHSGLTAHPDTRHDTALPGVLATL